MSAILEALAIIARPILRHHHADLTVNDAAICAGLMTGDVFLWCANTYGTHLVFVRRQEDDARPADARMTLAVCARAYFEGVCALYPGVQWFLCRAVDGPNGKVIACDRDVGRHLLKEATADAAPDLLGRTIRALLQAA